MCDKSHCEDGGLKDATRTLQKKRQSFIDWTSRVSGKRFACVGMEEQDGQESDSLPPDCDGELCSGMGDG